MHAKNGRKALSIVDGQASHIAAAVIELELPEVNGLNLTDRLASRQPKPKKIIATTFLKHELLLELARHMGANLVVRKPVSEQNMDEDSERAVARVGSYWPQFVTD